MSCPPTLLFPPLSLPTLFSLLETLPPHLLMLLLQLLYYPKLIKFIEPIPSIDTFILPFPIL